jgi:hypothetical protein
VLHIFTFCGKDANILHTRLVCVRWKQVIDSMPGSSSFWKQVYMHSWPLPPLSCLPPPLVDTSSLSSKDNSDEIIPSKEVQKDKDDAPVVVDWKELHIQRMRWSKWTNMAPEVTVEEVGNSLIHFAINLKSEHMRQKKKKTTPNEEIESMQKSLKDATASLSLVAGIPRWQKWRADYSKQVTKKALSTEPKATQSNSVRKYYRTKKGKLVLSPEHKLLKRDLLLHIVNNLVFTSVKAHHSTCLVEFMIYGLCSNLPITIQFYGAMDGDEDRHDEWIEIEYKEYGSSTFTNIFSRDARLLRLRVSNAGLLDLVVGNADTSVVTLLDLYQIILDAAWRYCDHLTLDCPIDELGSSIEWMHDQLLAIRAKKNTHSIVVKQYTCN